MAGKAIHIILFTSAAIFIFSLTGCLGLGGFFQNPDYIYEDGAVLVNGRGDPVELINNPDAVDVTYAGVLEFIREDLTDSIRYIERDSPSGETPFVCSDFAEAVHNNAEVAGIRAGYLSIDWEDGSIGHAINAFETTDLGIVYIDCTGRSAYSQIEDGGSSSADMSWDKVAYIEIGKKYGVIPLDFAELPYYFFFEQYDLKWMELKEKLTEYNAEVKLYNQEISGKAFYRGSSDLERIKAWEARLKLKEKELDDLQEELGDSRFRPLGLVKSFNIHW